MPLSAILATYYINYSHARRRHNDAVAVAMKTFTLLNGLVLLAFSIN